MFTGTATEMLRAAVTVMLLVAAGVWLAPPARAGCDYASRTITCDMRHRPDGSYAVCSFHVKLLGGAEADCVRVCPPLAGSPDPRPYVEGRPC
jgi:hypothetical protein